MADKIEHICNILAQHNPMPKSELEYKNHLTFLIAVMLSAQSTDKSVNKVTKNLFYHYNTTTAFLNLGVEQLKKFINKIGLYNNKSENIIKTCAILKNEYKFETEVPQSLDELMQLPGVGRKTASVVLSSLFQKPYIAVDTHVFRVSQRIGLSNENDPSKMAHKLENIIPRQYASDFNHWLVLHGRYICKARKPLCDLCLLSNYCNYYETIKNE